MQIKWLVRNSNAGSPKPAEVPIISEVVKRRKKRVGKKSMKAITTNPETQLNRCLLKFASGLTLCSKDFEDICYYAGLDPDMVHNRYRKCLDEKIIVFTEVQRFWIEYKNEYANYRAADSKEERRSVKKRIDMIKTKLNFK